MRRRIVTVNVANVKPLDTPTVYRLSKGFGELICQYFARWWDMNLIALRITRPWTREQFVEQRRNPTRHLSRNVQSRHRRPTHDLDR
jgi:nucleoside-diphosphate-sugar epimerase